jgi:hypothetical protein
MADLRTPKQPPASLLPPDFLGAPSPNIVGTRIDFSETQLPEYAGLYAAILDNVLTYDECRTLLRAAEATAPEKGWERAMVNIGGGRQAMHEDIRNCGRIIWDTKDVAARLWERIEHVPEVQEIVRLEHQPKVTGIGPSKRNEVWLATRPNERMRFLKYVGGEYFRPHCDGMYETPDRSERSYVTIHLYLNDTGVPLLEEHENMSEHERLEVGHTGLKGGATTFHSMSGRMECKLDVEPRAGRVLIFQHRSLLHSGDDVINGVKYTMRTDLMYTLQKGSEGAVRE